MKNNENFSWQTVDGLKFTVVSDKPVLHRASNESWPRVGSCQRIECSNGQISECDFWYHENGNLHTVTERIIQPAKQ